MTEPKKNPRSESQQSVVHRAQWLVVGMDPRSAGGGSGIIEDGALVLRAGKIQATGRYRDIARGINQHQIRDHGETLLTPALLNGHCHLELSHSTLAQKEGEQGKCYSEPTAWIRDLLSERLSLVQDNTDAAELILNQARQTLQRMSAAGVAFVGDIGNSKASRNISHGQNIRVEFLLELLGLTKEAETKTLARLKHITADPGSSFSCTAHAPYSTTPALMQAIKKTACRLGHIFSIHVAESQEEIDFLRTGKGVFRDFLLERGAWDGSFTIPGKGAVFYLENLGVIDENTLCVHCVHLEEPEIEILAARKAKVCLCPGSNRFLGVGKAPVPAFLAHDILPALGSDSKASNEMLNMWREMRLLREDHPGIAPAAVFAMASRGGAEAWGLASQLGTLEPGKQAKVLAIRCKEPMATAGDVLEFLTTAGDSVQTEWLE